MRVYQKVFKNPWSYMIGGGILALLNILLLAATGTPWRVTGGFFYWGIWLLETFGVMVNTDLSGVYDGLGPSETLLFNTVSILNLSVILGAMLSALSSNEFKRRKIKNKKQLIVGISGGFLMGYGARISFGCNVGSVFSGIPSFSLHGWIFWIFLTIGAYIGAKILMKYLL